MGTIETTSRILVTLDGSAQDTAAIAEAAKLAAGLTAQIILLRVVRPLRAGRFDTPGDLLPWMDRAERQADTELRTYEAAFPGLPVTRVVLVGSHPSKEIIGWLRGHPVSFVVMATRGESRLRRLIAGSLSEAVRRSGLAPVISLSERRRPAGQPGPAALAQA